MNQNQKNKLQRLLRTPVRWDCPLKDYTSFRIGGPAEALVSVENRGEMVSLLKFIDEERLSWRVIGRGTNLLVRDDGYKGIAIILAGDFLHYRADEKENDIVLQAGAGYSLTRLSSHCAEKGYGGMEFAIGIPGTVGGAVAMNAGAWGGSMADVLQSVELATSKGLKLYEKKDVSLGYRTFGVLNEDVYVILSATLTLQYEDPALLRQTCRTHTKKRRQSQPTGLGNAGSVFKNPAGDSAARLIDSCGLKGRRVGDAEVSKKHANFIVNHGEAKAADVLQLIAEIQETVRRDSGVSLEPEVHLL